MTRRPHFIIFTAAILATALAAGVPAQASGFCTALWAPVCALKSGVEQTYSNSGCAKADDATIERDGRCEDSAPATPAPADASTMAPKAPVPQPTFCTEDYLPVCAQKDGAARTYPNACHARVDGATVSAQGECPKP
jgi:hypothetical protein